MKKVDVEKIKELIEHYGLKPALQRDVSFLGHSFIGAAYVKDLKEFAGFGYGAIGAIWRDGVYHSMTNDMYIAEQVGLSLSTHKEALEKWRVLAMDIYRRNRQRFAETRSSKLPFSQRFLALLEIYGDYMVVLGFYNALMRFVGDAADSAGFNQSEWKHIGNERNESATLYNDLEQFFKTTCPKIGEEKGFDGDLLRWMSCEETRIFLGGKELDKKLLKEASERRKHCFSLITEENGISEYVLSDVEGVEEIYRKYYVVESTREMKGICAFPGNAQGRARVLLPNLEPGKIDFQEGDILIAVHTHPRYAPLIKKSAAIVTDEGGMLSHAAILARELKKPCIIGTKVVTKVLKDGDVVEVDADNGVVKMIKKADEA